MQHFIRFFAQLNAKPLPGPDIVSSTKITDLINIALSIIGSVAVLIIVIAGIRYIISRGDGNSVAQAKNAILYAVIGLVITLLAGVIVNFVLKGF